MMEGSMEATRSAPATTSDRSTLTGVNPWIKLALQAGIPATALFLIVYRMPVEVWSRIADAVIRGCGTSQGFSLFILSMTNLLVPAVIITLYRQVIRAKDTEIDRIAQERNRLSEALINQHLSHTEPTPQTPRPRQQQKKGGK
jgi:hypothetical protein